MFRLARNFLQHVVPGILKPLRILWNELIGFFFLVFAIVAIVKAVPRFSAYDGQPRSFFEICLYLIFGLTMLFFGVSSFRRARKISRS